MNKITLLIVFISCSLAMQGQQLRVNIPSHKDSEVSLLIEQGMRPDTIPLGRLDANGSIDITLPSALEGYRGFARILTEKPENGTAANSPFLLAGENLVLNYYSDPQTGLRMEVLNSVENDSLARWGIRQQELIQPISILNQMKVDSHFSSRFREQISQELMLFETKGIQLAAQLTESPLYAAKLIELSRFINEDVAPLMYKDAEGKAAVRDKMLKNLDIEVLYSSGAWYNTLGGLLGLYGEGSPYQDEFVSDMTQLLKRVKSDKIYAYFAETMFEICESQSWNEQVEQLAYFLINDNRLSKPTPRLNMLLTLYKLKVGSKVPALTQGALPKKNTILVFYDSGCENCSVEMNKLIAAYPSLKTKGYEVVSVAADVDKTTFSEYAGKFPWDKKYCNFEGFQGADFKNYGIIGTPSFYLIDSKGILQGRYAKFQDLNIMK